MAGARSRLGGVVAGLVAKYASSSAFTVSSSSSARQTSSVSTPSVRIVQVDWISVARNQRALQIRIVRPHLFDGRPSMGMSRTLSATRDHGGARYRESRNAASRSAEVRRLVMSVWESAPRESPSRYRVLSMRCVLWP